MRILQKSLIIFFLTICVFSINAQSAKTEQFTQTIEWEKDEYALQYEIVIEMIQSNGSTALIYTEKTSESKLILSLPAGQYRYKITTYDFLERPFAQSKWIPFNIIKAIHPIITLVSPEDVYFIKGVPSEITLSGDGIYEESKIVLRDSEKKKTLNASIVRKEENGDIVIQVETQNMRNTVYTIVVTNPGNLSDSSAKITAHEAIQPVILETDPQQLILQKGEDAIISVEGEGFNSQTVFEFASSDGILHIPAGVKFSEEKNKAISVTVHSPKEGSYILIATNPGGLNNSSLPISVRRTIAPSLTKATSGNYKLIKDKELVIVFEGTGFQEDSLFYLLPENKAQEKKVSISEKGAIACTRFEIRPDGIVEATFNTSNFANTVYTAVVENPGNLTAFTGRQEIFVISATDLMFCGGGFFATTVYNDELLNHNEEPLFKGYSLDLAFIPFKKPNGYWGSDISFFQTSNFYENKSVYKLSMQLSMVHLNFLYQIPFNFEQTRISFHAGPGFSVLGKELTYSNDTFGDSYNKKYSLFVSAQIGVNATVFLKSNFFFRGSLDFVHIFAKDMPTGIFLPSLSLGLRL